MQECTEGRGLFAVWSTAVALAFGITVKPDGKESASLRRSWCGGLYRSVSVPRSLTNAKRRDTSECDDEMRP